MHSRKFLCCLPVRLGCFVLSLLQFALGGILAAGLWLAIFNERQSRAMTRAQKISSILVAADMTIFALGSLFGFIGTLIKKRAFIRLYKTVLAYHLGISIALGLSLIIFLFMHNQQIIDACIDGSTDTTIINLCHHVRFKWFAIGFLVVIWLIQLYCIIIVSRYDQQLGEEQNEKRAMPLSASYNYIPAPTGETHHYPYTDSHHSYGNSGV